MKSMIVPMIIGAIGFFLTSTGSSTKMHAFTVFGVIALIVAGLWLLYNACFNLGYMLA